MIGTRRLTVALLCGCLLAAGCPLFAPRLGPAEVAPTPPPVAPPDRRALESAIDRGVAFLVRTQNPGGSWGTIRHKAFNITMPVPAGHFTMRVATTSLCVMALIETQSDEPGAAEALRRGEDWLIENVSRTRMCSRYITYNHWAHAYALRALVRMFERAPKGSERRAVIGSLIEEQLARLIRHQHLDGGWGYYLGYILSVPSPSNGNSFMTATVLVAMHEAHQAGFEVPKKTIDAALAFMRRQRRPDFSYSYSGDAARSPTWPLSKPPGSLARSQVCNAAMRHWGDTKTSIPILKAWLNRLFARNQWLSMARKTQYPHQGHFGIAAYFFYYGHFYAAECIGLLPPEDRPFFQDHLAHVLLPLQEKDGSWWDYALYNYHQQYGTAMALVTLTRCRRPPEPPAVATGKMP